MFNTGVRLEFFYHISWHALRKFGFKHRLLELDLNFHMWRLLLFLLFYLVFLSDFRARPQKIRISASPSGAGTQFGHVSFFIQCWVLSGGCLSDSGHALIFFGFKHRRLELELNFHM